MHCGVYVICVTHQETLVHKDRHAWSLGKSGYGNGLTRCEEKVEEKEEAMERSGLALDLIVSYYQLKRLKTVHTT